MSKGFNYSKWDNIELSDDESDLHPNIDKDSWFRLKHRTRLEREEKEDNEIKVNDSKTNVDNNRIKIIEARLNRSKNGEKYEDDEFDDVDALEEELGELKDNIDKRQKRKMEIDERRKWNIDNICVVKEEKTMVNSKVTKSLVAAETDGAPDDLDNMTIGEPEKEASSSGTSTSVTWGFGIYNGGVNPSLPPDTLSSGTTAWNAGVSSTPETVYRFRLWSQSPFG